MARPTGNKDLYATIGVPRDADADAIKSAYRKQAQKYHPDRNTDDPTAEEKFKEISSAYAVLSDSKRRKDYDEFGDIALDPNFDAKKYREATRGFGGAFTGADGGAGFQGGGGIGNLFEDLFGGGGQRRAPRPRRGADLETSLELDFIDAVKGCEQRITLDRIGQPGQSETLTVTIPPGIDDGARIRLSGKGAPGTAGGPPGDLFAKVSVRQHAFFKRNDRDLTIETPISVAEAISGASIEIPTLDGRVTLRVPPSTDGGTRLRLRGKGVPAHGRKSAGDLYVAIRIRVPKEISPATMEKLSELLEDDANAWRTELFG